jgi:hypothetical protein
MTRCPFNLLLDASNKSSELWPMQVSLHWQLEYYIYLLYLARFFVPVYTDRSQESQEYLAVHAWCLDDVLPVRSVLYNILIHLVKKKIRSHAPIFFFWGGSILGRPYKSICRKMLVLSAVPINDLICRGGSISSRSYKLDL